ncbi:D-proline reductase (dithiol) proprotein PrdA [Sansalvadorimonas sp. 2012CJ34-2]|uniref:D-proline reductase (Dithiol) proprotein PrdA n=1 Tax=Parendozoicomonas callyspongiae TaxID=2942213 RepID=A0ABT0PCZ5_9GAMM|nr:D-proline reductase (dithiol) proprotein PrdA [Sansalvadorimonas sp. 2012CJ34-2]MCL6269254.1 D-proline reductase (dithiol) proprotein PrdA [Sansalvadorimonas sp. 2012CJ34-2]
MAINSETAKAHENDPAVTCCRFEAGVVLEPSNLEDPVLFPDLEESGLLTMPEGCLTIGEVMGATLKQTVEALTPLTTDLLEGVTAKAEEVAPQVQAEEQPAQAVSISNSINGGMLKIHIGEGKNINLEIPMNGQMAAATPEAALGNSAPVSASAPVAMESAPQAEKELRRLTKKHFKIEKVAFGNETAVDGTTLFLREGIEAEAVDQSDLVVDMKVEIITPDQYNTYSETIMDVQPIATKEEGDKLGLGTTRVLDGVIMMVTGTDENGVQIGEFGSSEGILEENIQWGRPGAPDHGDIFIKTQVTIKAGTNMERPGPLAAHSVSDYITQEIRNVVKKLADDLVVETEELVQYRRPGKRKVVVVKEVMGQGAMHDNIFLPSEPVGIMGGKPNVDLGNLPVVMSPLEVLDGGIHALTCIGPASKECSRHYWREPLVIEAMNDPEIDLCGIVMIGSPQVNAEKFYTSERLGMLVEALDVDGAIVTTEGFGNNHIDFASHIEQIGMREIDVVGMSFCAVQGALVVGNKYMKHMVDNNKSEEGIENEILSCNTLCKEDAVRALTMLKSAMAGEEIKAPERKWNPNVKENNLELCEQP